MATPDLIPINHEPGYRTDTIGRFADGQFFGSVVAGFADGIAPDGDWAAHKRWYAVLHRFDQEGNHVSSDIQFAGTTADGESRVVDKATGMLRQWLDELPGRSFGDISIRLFQVEVDGVTFGLIDETSDDDGYVELYPDELGFYEPWSGDYDT
ncbi:formate hydrogenlyase regulatory protein HycA [Allocatelliglobosispora scoriae]|uniref:Formate hydrogenlyase regulatory protein HycA n=1 Tax=Allocatelliglobosispora scoriae TaxID=643052 RepID=A0A841C0J7_9ACTN|nr:hypothetical protein [Allocatelliglobosispora scoriae]MBB5872673.1 formate hydrogenlyase regulatory protein HycA [Allocatelliglobosispora scoriae]